MKNQTLRRVVQGAMMIALATVLSMLKIFEAPYGGSVTLGSMVPIVLFAILYRKEPKWGVLVGLAHGVLQLLLGLNAIAGIDFASWIGAVFLDYIIAFTVLGLAGLFARKFRNLVVGSAVGSLIVCVLRFVCHFLSGILIWGAYAPEGQSAWFYSLTYNGGYMLVETIITVVLVTLLVAVLPLKKMGFDPEN